jgi:cobalt-zinc-cadmium efflux system membrane fusion protein
MRSLAGFFSLTLLLAACDSAPAPAPAPPPFMPATATATATPASELLLAELPATVVQPPGSRVAVAAPLAGLVREVLVQPGQAVSKGQLLAVLVSREALVMAGDVARAGARAEVASAEAARMQALAREGVVAAARAEAARAAGRRRCQCAGRPGRNLRGGAGHGRHGRRRPRSGSPAFGHRNRQPQRRRRPGGGR